MQIYLCERPNQIRYQYNIQDLSFSHDLIKNAPGFPFLVGVEEYLGGYVVGFNNGEWGGSFGWVDNSGAEIQLLSPRLIPLANLDSKLLNKHKWLREAKEDPNYQGKSYIQSLGNPEWIIYVDNIVYVIAGLEDCSVVPNCELSLYIYKIIGSETNGIMLDTIFTKRGEVPLAGYIQGTDLYIVTHDALYYINLITHEYQRLSVLPYEKWNRFNVNSLVRTSSGEFYLAGRNGIGKLTPKIQSKEAEKFCSKGYRISWFGISHQQFE